jgi:hypothetical protein
MHLLNFYTPFSRRATIRLTRGFSTAPSINNNEQNTSSGSSIPNDIAMPTPLSLGYDMRYHSSASSVNSSSPRPIAIIAGWMGAKERQMKPYVKFYLERNIDTISFAVGPHHVLNPANAMKQMESVLNTVYKLSDDNNNNNNKDTGMVKKDQMTLIRPSGIIFHHFSVGGFLFGQALIAMKNDPKLSSLTSSIKAQIFDSPPDYTNIANGISHSMGFQHPIARKCIELLAKSYLLLTSNSAGVLHKASSSAFHNNDLTAAPSLWFYSKSDPVADWRDCEIVTRKWRAKGIMVEECVWEHSPHIQHARADPERYFGTLETFLQRHKVI